MSILIVGGDRVATYREQLRGLGFEAFEHWSGRTPSDCRRAIPRATRLVVILIDHVNHGLARKVRQAADQRAIDLVYSHSLSGLGQALADYRQRC